LSNTAARAEHIAAAVSIPEQARFQRVRGEIRKALVKAGVAPEIDKLVAELLDKKG
jgi:hypothetical protein